MAGRKKTNKKPGKAAKIALSVFAMLALGVGAVMGISAINANTVRLRRAEVALSDLPTSFEGVRVLYVSDIDLCGINTPEKSAALINALEDARPDILLLGGDYTAPSLLEILNRPDENTQNNGKHLRARSSFFHYIRSFDAPLGKYAIAAPEDRDWDGLRALLEDCGFQSLINASVSIERNGERLWLAGICENSANLNAAGTTFKGDECVLLCAYSPEILPILLTSEASDGGPWADLMLCGHTHGGQIRLFGRSVLNLTRQEQKYLSGWTTDNGMPILTTTGVGCEGLNLRLGSEPEVWLITLSKSKNGNVSRETIG